MGHNEHSKHTISLPYDKIVNPNPISEIECLAIAIILIW